MLVELVNAYKRTPALFSFHQQVDLVSKWRWHYIRFGRNCGKAAGCKQKHVALRKDGNIKEADGT